MIDFVSGNELTRLPASDCSNCPVKSKKLKKYFISNKNLDYDLSAHDLSA